MIKKIQANQYKSSEWSGGSTSEIYIHPIGADFTSGNYEARISLAKVELEESLFTPLPDVERTLTVLEGNHQLSLNDRGFVPVNQYSPVTFSGNDKTESRGKALNFNFMKKTSDAHELNVMQADQKERIVLMPKYKNALVFIIDGKAETSAGELNSQDSLFFDEELMIILEAKTLFVKVDF